jgi:metal-sulfur cluster biosynthetic enzyme
MDPEIPVNIVDLGLIYGVTVKSKNDIDIKMTMTTRGCPLHNTLVNDVKQNLGMLNGVGKIDVEIVWDPPWTIEKMDPKVRDKLGFGKQKLRFRINYETDKPQKQGVFSKSDDGSLILINNDNKSFMVNDAIVAFWESCDNTKTINQLTDYFSEKLGLPRQQIEQEVLQLLEQLFDANLIRV